MFTGRKACQKEDLSDGYTSTKASEGRIRQYCFYTIKLSIFGEMEQDKVKKKYKK